MAKGTVELVYTADEYDCDDCGGSYENSWLIRYKGKQYGLPARAHCFGGQRTELEDVLVEFLTDQGYAVSRISECYGESND